MTLKKQPARKRLSGEEARARILDAAVGKLREDGPLELKLSALAKELGISHQAILHHFGSRDGLVAAVVKNAFTGLHAELAGGLSVLRNHEDGAAVLIARAFEVLADQGFGRLFAWLALAFPDGHAELAGKRDLEMLSRMMHAVREREHGEADPKDTKFLLIVLTYVVLGSAIFEDGTFRAAGLGDDPEAKQEFRRWLAALVHEHLEA